ncbi:unnamed protein product [Lupinus luteus]|uniref:Sec-independent protein translocase protein TATA, chloroplastic n=1 Tax=Lupinus luteus TaxID=3873 RepID=A0AAV1X4N3_LUPLU
MDSITASLTFPLRSSSSCSIPFPKSLHFSSSQLSFSATNSNLLMKAENMSITATRSRTQIRRTKPFSCNAVFGLGVPEIVVIAGVAAVVFGPKNLPLVGRNFGKTIKSFQQAAKEFESELKKVSSSSEETLVEELTAVKEQQEQDTKVFSTKDKA